MSDHNFVLTVNDGTHPTTIEKIARRLMELPATQLHSGARSMDAVLHDMLQGIQDKVLLKTPLTPAGLEQLLKEHLRGDYKRCRIEWMTAG